MLSKYRCLFVLFWSIVYVNSSKEPRKKPSCEIVTPYSTPYVYAYLNHLTKGRGCSTNNTSPTKQAVHVVNLKVNQHSDDKRTKVYLRIEQLISENTDLNLYHDYGRPLVFILNSDKPVKWKVELSQVGQLITSIKHLFVVPSHSSIRFKKSMIKVRGRKISLQNYVNKTDLVNWVKRRFKALTTYSEVEGTSLLFRVGMESDAGSTCDLSNLHQTPHILTSHKEHQTITGCKTKGRRHYLSKPVYIIELQQAPEQALSESTVDLDITSFNNEPLTKDFYLILKSPANIKWKIRSRKLQGWIDIVTDADADLKGIRMQTVASRREIMSSSGDELIQWAEKYIAAVEMYLSVNVANQIQLMLHSDKGTRLGQTSNPPYHGGVVEETDRGDLHDIIHTVCSVDRLTVLIPSFLLQEWALVKEQITLLDQSCGAKQNSSHIILESSLTACNTKHMQIDDNYVFSNAIVIHAAADTDSFMEDIGSGYSDPTEMSGAGTNDLSTSTYMDDEDFQSRKVEIDVQCELPKTVLPSEKPDSIVSQDSDYRLEVFTSESYDEPIKILPILVSNSQQIYIQASITSDIPLKVQVENCWLSPSDSQDSTNTVGTEQQLINNGCARDNSLQWHNLNMVPGRSKHFKNLTPFSRFSFPLLDHFNGQQTFLYCELSQCQMHFLDNSIDIPQCPDSPREHCEKQLPPGLKIPVTNSHLAANHKILMVGPLGLGNQQVQINGGIYSGDNSGPKSGTDGQTTEEVHTPHQQSVIIEGLDSGTVVGIAFAAFAIGILLTGTLWFIQTHTGPSKHVLSSHGSTETTGELSPNTTQLPASA